jgi:hypothetical protein
MSKYIDSRDNPTSNWRDAVPMIPLVILLIVFVIAVLTR